MGGLPLCELNQLELEFLFLCNFDLHVKLEDMQAYGDQLLTHALTQQRTLLEEKQNNNLRITSSLCVSLPPLSPPVSATSPHSSPPPPPTPTDSNTLKRKRDNKDNESNTSIKIQRSEVLLDKALIPSTSSTKANNTTSSTTSLLCNKLYSTYTSSHHHLDTILSSYTHDC